MTKFFVVTETENSSPYALVVHNSINVKSYPLSRSADEWAHWVNNENHEITEIVSSLGLNLEYGDSQPVTTKTLEPFKNVLPESVYDFVKTLSRQPTIEFTDNVRGYGRRYVVNSDVIHRKRHQRVETKNLIPSVSTNILKRQAYIDRKAMTFRSDNTFSELAFNLKAARAMWDPDLGPSGGWRCPKGSRYGGYITDRFGRGCGGGIIRRVGRALVNAGRGLDNLADRRDRRRLNRAAERAAKPRGAGARDRAERVAQGLERGARRILQGEELQADVANRRVRRNIDRPAVRLEAPREGMIRPNVQQDRQNFVRQYDTIDDELKALDEKLNNLGLGYYSREQLREMEDRKLHLEEEKRKLGGGAKPPPKRIPKDPVRDFFEERAREERIPIDGRDPFGRLRVPQNYPGRESNRRPQRRPGSRPVRRPVTENRGRGGEVGRRVRPRPERGQDRYAPGWKPGEYKPGDKDRIAQRENRYAKVSTDQLYRALELNAPRDLKPGESADVEARRRQERLEILQELINRDLDIPERYKREAKIYRLKKQRKQGAKPKRNERVAQALERAARRIVGGEGGRSREERRQRRMERRAERRERAARALERGAERLVGGDRERRERAARALERGAERLVGEDEKRPRSQRERARSAVVEQAQRSPVKKPQRKRRDVAFDALAGKDELDNDFRQALLEDFVALADEWQKRLGDVPLTREAMDKYIADREGKRAPAFIGALKAKANDWDVLRDYFQKEFDADMAGRDMSPEERLAILEKLGPTRKRKLRERMAQKLPVPKSRSERTPSRPRTPVPSRPRTPTPNIPPVAPNGQDIPPDLQTEFDVYKNLYGELADVLLEEYGARVAADILRDIGVNGDRFFNNHNDDLKNARVGDRRFDPDNRVQYGSNLWENLPFIPDFPTTEESSEYREALQERIREVGAGVMDGRARLKDMSPTQRAEHMREEAALQALKSIEFRFNADRERQQIVHLNQLNAAGKRRGDAAVASVEVSIRENLRRNRLNDLSPTDSDLDELSASELAGMLQRVGTVIESNRRLIIDLEKDLADRARLARDGNGLVRNLDDPEAEQYVRNYAKLQGLKKVDKQLVDLENAITRARIRNRDAGRPRAPEPVGPRSATPVPTPSNGVDSRTAASSQIIPQPASNFAPSNIISGRNGRRLPDRRLADYNKAVEHLYVNGGQLEDIPDEVVVRAMLHDAIDANGDPLDIEDALQMGFAMDWENDRFSGELLEDKGQGVQVWQVFKVTDKKTGEVWYFKTSAFGDFDAANEMLGAAMAQGLGFGLGLEHVRFGDEVNRNGKPGRWLLMRNIADMDHGSDIPSGARWMELAHAAMGGRINGDASPEDVARLAVMDYVLHNLDRHGGNAMMVQDKNGVWRVGIIDNGLIGGGHAPNAERFIGQKMNPEEFLREIIGRDVSPADYGRPVNQLAIQMGLADPSPENWNNAIQTLKHIYQHKDAQRERQFREQAQKALEQLRQNVARIISKEVLEANGIKLSQAELDYIDIMKELIKHRLDKLEAGGLDELVGLF